MARGKHSTAASARRLAAALSEAEAYRKAYQQEARARQIAQNAADRVDGLEAEIKKLHMDLDLATSDELQAAQEVAQEAQEALGDAVEYVLGEVSSGECADCGSRRHPRISVEFWNQLRGIIGTDALAAIFEQDDDTRRTRRNRQRHSERGWERMTTLIALAKECGLDEYGTKDAIAADLRGGQDLVRFMQASLGPDLTPTKSEPI